jgi:hypothetical protein
MLGPEGVLLSGERRREASLMLREHPVLVEAAIDTFGTKLVPSSSEANGHLGERPHRDIGDLGEIGLLRTFEASRVPGKLIRVTDDVAAEVRQQNLRTGRAGHDVIDQLAPERRTPRWRQWVQNFVRQHITHDTDAVPLWELRRQGAVDTS